MATEIITSFQQVSDSSGNPLSGALVYVYDVGTTTLKSVWTDTALLVAGANPIVTDSAGRHDMRYIATGSYKIVVKTSAGVTQYTRDNVDGRVPVGSGALAIANGGTGATSAAAAVSALGAATSAEVAEIAADVAALAGTLASTESTHIATGTTAQRAASPIEGDIRRNTTTTYWEGFVSSWKRFLTEDDLTIAGSVVKSSLTEYTTSADITTVMPYDNTIPQITEGAQIISVSFTPTSATNLLRFRFQGFAAKASGAGTISVALFGGAVASAIAATASSPAGDDLATSIVLEHQEVSGTTSAKTFAIRVGPEANTIRMNGTSLSRRFGGVARSTLVIEEIKV